MSAMSGYGITYWKDGDKYVGYADKYPEYWTQGDTLEDLKKSIRSLVEDIEGPGDVGRAH